MLVLALTCACSGQNPSQSGDADSSTDTATEDSGEISDPTEDEHVDPTRDSDGDTITDADEDRDAEVDTDGDTIPDYLDEDSDDDGIPDSTEAGDSDIATPPWDTDMDGTPDFRDEDSDEDGLTDAWELEHGLNPYSDDSDMDGVPDPMEVRCGSDPLDAGSRCDDMGHPGFVMWYNDPTDPPYPPQEPEAILDYLATRTGDTGGPSEIKVALWDDPSDSVDTISAFIDHVEPDVTGGRPDPRDEFRFCTGGLDVDDIYAPFDGPDSFTSVPADTTVCFDIHVKMNTTVRCTDETLGFTCFADVLVDSTLVETRLVFFVVPLCIFDWD